MPVVHEEDTGDGIVIQIFVEDEDPVVPITSYPCEPIKQETQPPSDLDLANDLRTVTCLAAQLRPRDRRLVHSDNSKLWNAWSSHRKACTDCGKGYFAHMAGKDKPDTSLFCVSGWVRYNEFNLHCRAMTLAGK